MNQTSELATLTLAMRQIIAGINRIIISIKRNSFVESLTVLLVLVKHDRSL